MINEIEGEKGLQAWAKGLMSVASSYCGDDKINNSFRSTDNSSSRNGSSPMMKTFSSSLLLKSNYISDFAKFRNGLKDTMMKVFHDYDDYAQKTRNKVTSDLNNVESNIDKLKRDIYIREKENAQNLGGHLFQKIRPEKDVLLEELNSVLVSQGEVAK